MFGWPPTGIEERRYVRAMHRGSKTLGSRGNRSLNSTLFLISAITRGPRLPCELPMEAERDGVWHGRLRHLAPRPGIQDQHVRALRRRVQHDGEHYTLVFVDRPLSMRRLASDASTSTTAVYSLFGSKAALLDELYREAVRRFARALATVDPTVDPAADIVRFGVVYREYALADPHMYTIMFTRHLADLALGPDHDPARDDEAGQTFQPLLNAVRRGQAMGRFRRQAPAEQIALACWAMVHGLVTLELNGKLPRSHRWLHRCRQNQFRARTRGRAAAYGPLYPEARPSARPRTRC